MSVLFNRISKIGRLLKLFIWEIISEKINPKYLLYRLSHHYKLYDNKVKGQGLGLLQIQPLFLTEITSEEFKRCSHGLKTDLTLPVTASFKADTFWQHKRKCKEHEESKKSLCMVI